MKTPVSLNPVLLAEQADTAPEWVHLLPARSGAIQTADRRGPYTVADAEALIAASFEDADRLPIDENHATDLAAPQGLPAPARGWITAMQAREDGIWGRVEWTDEGRRMVAGRAYRALSPVIQHTATKTVLRILRASLVNRPNLRGLAALNQETSMDFMAQLIEALGLEAGATEEHILAAIRNRKKEGDAAAPALQSAITEIGTALGVQGDTSAIVAAARKAGASTDAMTALQSEVTTLRGELTALQGAGARARAEAFVDGAIADLRAGVNAGKRDFYVSLHMKNPAETEELINGLPKLGHSGLTIQPPATRDGEVSLNAAQIEAATLLGLSQDDYRAALKAEGAR